MYVKQGVITSNDFKYLGTTLNLCLGWCTSTLNCTVIQCSPVVLLQCCQGFNLIDNLQNTALCIDLFLRNGNDTKEIN